MDRRQAIKKLAAGTAIASGGSLVMSSRAVAYAASGDPSGPPVETVDNSNGTVTITITDVGAPPCASGSDTLYSWRINGFNINGGETWKFFVRDSTDSQTIVEGVGPYSMPNPNHGTVVLRKTNKPGKLKPLQAGDSYDISALVTWPCAGSSAEYWIRGTYPNAPSVEVDWS